MRKYVLYIYNIGIRRDGTFMINTSMFNEEILDCFGNGKVITLPVETSKGIAPYHECMSLAKKSKAYIKGGAGDSLCLEDGAIEQPVDPMASLAVVFDNNELADQCYKTCQRYCLEVDLPLWADVIQPQDKICSICGALANQAVQIDGSPWQFLCSNTKCRDKLKTFFVEK